MTIEDKLKSVDVKLMLIKLELNSNYGVSYGISFHSIMDEMYILKKQKLYFQKYLKF